RVVREPDRLHALRGMPRRADVRRPARHEESPRRHGADPRPHDPGGHQRPNRAQADACSRPWKRKMIRAASRLVAGTVLVLLNSAPASAQAPAVAAPAPPAPLQAGFQDGFFIQTPTGDYRLLFGLVAQEDGRFVVDDLQHAVTDTFTIRKIRPTWSGRIARYFDFEVMPDFGNGTAVVQDAYFDVRFSPKFR